MNGLTDESTAGADGPWTLPGYTHERELGAGGSGRVVLARHEATGTRVAVKYLSAAVGDTSAFRREAELLGALRSPQVARLYEYVEGPRGAAIVMELVDGIALRALLRQEGATSPEAALVVLKGSLLGLAAAHAAGVVHRDYKPENVLVTVDGSSKLVDFGIAVPHGATGKIAGTPVYMAPEQWAGRPASPSADVYAATATFFECLTGAKPYNGTTLAELAAQHTEAPIPDQLAPEPVRSLIRAGLAKTPGERPASAAALVEQLELVAHAGYGAKWEERGRDALAALVALLPLLLLPSGGGAAAGSTALATTVLGGGAADFAPAGDQLAVPRTGLSRRVKVLAGAVGVVLLGGAMVDVAVADGPGAWGTTRITTAGPPAELTTSLAPAADVAAAAAASAAASVSASTSASASGSPSPSAAASPSGSATASATASPQRGGGAAPSSSRSAAAGPAPTSTGGPAAGPSTAPSAGPTAVPTVAPTSPSSSAPATPSSVPTPLRVLAVSITGYGCYGNYGTSGTVDVTSDGAAAGALTVSWVDDDGGSRKVVASQTFTLAKGQTRTAFPVSHTFADSATFWGLQVATDPAAVRGQGGYQEVAAYLCNPPR
ncbi:serine/threonine-protein kinase [Kitasatospora sp. GAS1066B]|uniref:serine/threonine-protein kinase n=1 Tax=Kitasatospora sp. GAS1066B TaxID=3156271 RepID=UPI0035110652